MDIPEALQLINDVRVAEEDPSTVVGAASSLRRHLGVLCTVGSLLPDGQFAIYANAPECDLPAEWNGYPVVSVFVGA